MSNFEIPDPARAERIQGPNGEILMFRHFQLVRKFNTSFDPRLDADVKAAQTSHQRKVQTERRKWRGLEPIDAMQDIIRDWTEDGSTHGGSTGGRYLGGYGRLCTILAVPGNFIGSEDSPEGKAFMLRETVFDEPTLEQISQHMGASHGQSVQSPQANEEEN